MATVLDTTHHHSAPHAHTAGTKAANLPRPKPVSVNGVTIPRAHIGRETQHHPAAKPIDAWTAAARALVVRELLLQEARRLAIVPLPQTEADGRRETDDEALTRMLIDGQVVTPEADEPTCRRIYEQRRATFRSSNLYGVRHILVAAAPGDDAGRAEAKVRAQAIIAEVRADPSVFPHLAASASACSSRDTGGALGQISRGQTVPEFESALADAPVGEIMPQPVETRYGFHAVIVDRRIEGRELPFEMVHQAIADWLASRSHETAVRQYIGMLASRATITGITLDAAASPLEQERSAG